MLKDGGVHGGVNLRSSGAIPGMESVKERFREDAVGGVRLGEDSSCKRDRICGQYGAIGEQRRGTSVTYIWRLCCRPIGQEGCVWPSPRMV